MSYLRDNPVFHHVLVLERGDALWLVPDEGGRWTLPGFVSDEQHTAEVELLAHHMRARYGLRLAILGTVASDFDDAANRVYKAYLAEALTDTPAPGRWWPRPALAAGEAPLGEDAQPLVARWVTKTLSAGDTAWSRPGWLAEALAWVSAHAGAVSDVEQVRVSEFSTVIRVVAGGRVRYFKAVAPPAAREPAVTAALARRTAHVPPVLAVDGARGFLLMEGFAGEPLATGDVAVWADVAAALGELQRECIDAVGELQALGCEVTRATTLVAPLSAMVTDADALLVGEAAGLTTDEVAALRTLAPRVVADARALDAGPLPLTVDHGDLWPSNVLVGPGGCAFVDWEDVRVAHPFVSAFQLLAGAHLDRRFVDEPAAYTAVREAYLRGWSAWAPALPLRQAFDAAHDVAAVAVAASYRRYPPAVVAAHPWMREMPPFCLRRIITRRAWTDTSPR
ncbi:MAG: aminoglycoside phosphotransferase family protein [Anaeromyxobacteraceae bacterium]